MNCLGRKDNPLKIKYKKENRNQLSQLNTRYRGKTVKILISYE